MKTIDLHTHSNYSDGTCSPEELIILAGEKGLSALALTDHDTAAGVSSALEAMKKLNSNLEFIPGTELSVDYKGKEIHMVGLYIDWKDEEFIQKTSHYVKLRKERNIRMIQNFNDAGIPITLEMLQEGNPDTVITRAHFARAIIKLGVVKDTKEAFANYLGKDSPLYVARQYMNAFDAITLIKKTGGIPILAHPLHYKFEEKKLHTMIQDLKDGGLVGIEVRYSNHTEQDTHFVGQLAMKYDLLPSGGSDFHGSNKPLISLGTGRGTLSVPYEYLENIKKYKESQSGR